MKKNLPHRPNLDHLRKQAKAMLTAIEARDADAASTMIEFLPAARQFTPAQVFEAKYRLADAQSAIARKLGFGAWPALARHVEQLRALEGTWTFVRLELDGSTLPGAALQSSRILIDGDRFRTESPEGIYEGIFNIDVEAEPHVIDIEFIAGPEAGNTNYGIFRLKDDQLEICLDMTGKPRPTDFRAPRESGHAYETLQRASAARPAEVTGGKAPPKKAPSPATDPSEFPYVESETLTKLQGEWSAVKIVLDGQELPKMILPTARRSANKNEVKISVGGTTMIHALVRINESVDPIQIDYCLLDAAAKGMVQHGLFKWDGADACFCMGAPGNPRPADFASTPGSGQTLSVWRLKK